LVSALVNRGGSFGVSRCCAKLVVVAGDSSGRRTYAAESRCRATSNEDVTKDIGVCLIYNAKSIHEVLVSKTTINLLTNPKLLCSHFRA
jgi:hypothetical protein